MPRRLFTAIPKAGLALLVAGAAFGQGADTLLVDAEPAPASTFDPEDDTILRGEALGRLWLSGRRPGVDTGVWFLDPVEGLQPFLVRLEGPSIATSTELIDVAELPGGVALLIVNFNFDVRLLSTDGTPEGTVDLGLSLPEKFVSGTFPPPQRHRDIVVRGGVAFVRAFGAGNQEAVYSTDGTVAGTVLRDDPFVSGDRAGLLWPFLDGAVYTVRDGFDPRELRFLSGASGPPTTLLTIAPLTPFVLDPLEVGDRLVFSWPAVEGADDLHLRVTDGTAAGTQVLVDLPPSEFGLPRLIDAGPSLGYFSADSDAFGRELWRTDGTTAGTFRVLDQAPGPDSGLPFSSAGAILGAALGDGLVFSGGSTFAPEPYFTDGTAAGTVPLGPIEGGLLNGSSPGGFISLAGAVAFAAGKFNLPAVIGREAYVTGGTLAGTELVQEVQPGPVATNPFQLTEFAGELHFLAEDAVGLPTIYRGSPTELVELGRVAAFQGTESSLPAQFVSAGGRGFFTTSETSLGATEFFALWSTDGSSAGTEQIKPANVQLLQALGTLDRSLIFIDRPIPFVNTPTPWVSDGTVGGTFTLATNSEPAAAGGAPVGSANPQLGGEFFFGGLSATAGRELWATDGTPEGTRLVADLIPGAGDGVDLGSVSRVGNGLVFRSRPGGIFGAPATLQRSDGTAAGTGALAPAAFAGRSLRHTTGFGERIAIGVTVDNVPGIHEVWLSDGTDAGTTLLGSYPGQLREIRSTRGRLVLLTDDGLYGVGDDGLREALPPAGAGFPAVDMGPRGLGGALVPFELAADSGFDPGLWVTDGTAAGTLRVSDQLLLADVERLGDSDLLLYPRLDPDAGIELWLTDGTAGGERIAADLAPGPASSSPTASSAIAGGRQLLSAFRIEEGEEPHGLDVVAAGGFVARPFGSGCGELGRYPDLRFAGEARLGSTVEFELADFEPSGLGRLYIGFAAGAEAFGGCRIYLAGATLPLATAALDGAGAASLPVAIPAEPALAGLPLFLQAAGTGPGGPAPGGLELSNGFELRIGMP